YHYKRHYHAERGRHGEGSNRHGSSGNDLVLKVPLGTVVADRDTREHLGDLAASGQRILAVRGARGGRGNARFATSTNRAPRRADLGRPGPRSPVPPTHRADTAPPPHARPRSSDEARSPGRPPRHQPGARGVLAGARRAPADRRGQQGRPPRDPGAAGRGRAALRRPRPPAPRDLGGHGRGARRPRAGCPKEAGGAQVGAGRKLGRVRRLVVKVGSGLVTKAGAGVAPERIEALAAEIAVVREGRHVVLVTSGAIATGVARLGLAERPRAIPEKQAAAAVGQSALMWQYEAAFSRHGIPVGQVLLTAEDVSVRARYLNARNTLDALLRFGVLPIVNENDTVAVGEIKVGDNDNLSALVASLIDADLLVLLT